VWNSSDFGSKGIYMSDEKIIDHGGFSASGWLSNARRLVSPNCDFRPFDCRVEVVVLHSISLPPGHFDGHDIELFFTNKLQFDRHPFYAKIRRLRVSAHFLIRRDGELIQFVSVHQRAWHAGVSYCLGRDAVNDFSLGIELEGTDHSCFTEQQYCSLQELLRETQVLYPYLNGQCLFSHSEISPGRKTDPGPGLNWQRVRQMMTG